MKMTRKLAVAVGEYNLGRAKRKTSVTGWSKTPNDFLARFLILYAVVLPEKRAFCFVGKL